MRYNVKLIRLGLRVLSAKAKVEAAHPEDRKHREKILLQRERIFFRATDAHVRRIH